MSITDPSKIDALGVDKRTGDVVLTITDHLDWDAPASHLAALEAKVNAYIEFSMGDQMLEIAPDAADRRIVINLVQRVDPPDEIVQILERLKRQLRDGGFGFRWETASA